MDDGPHGTRLRGIGRGSRTSRGEQPSVEERRFEDAIALAQERIEVTRWRGLLTAGFVAAAVLGAGLGFPPLAAGGAILAAATLLVSFAVRPLHREVPRRRVRLMRETAAYRWSRAIQRRLWLWLASGDGA